MNVVEAPVWIALNGTRRMVLSCSPHEPGALALGHLLGEGWIDQLSDVTAWRIADGGVYVELDDARIAARSALRRHQIEHGCGLRHVLDCDASSLPHVDAAAPPGDSVSLLRSLFRAADEHAPDGGMHAVAMSEGSMLHHLSVDVARHSAVDRTLGLALLARDTDNRGLVLTARVSGTIALKAARARVAWIASRSIATSLAHEICAAAGIHLIERAGRA